MWYQTGKPTKCCLCHHMDFHSGHSALVWIYMAVHYRHQSYLLASVVPQSFDSCTQTLLELRPVVPFASARTRYPSCHAVCASRSPSMWPARTSCLLVQLTYRCTNDVLLNCCSQNDHSAKAVPMVSRKMILVRTITNYLSN